MTDEQDKVVERAQAKLRAGRLNDFSYSARLDIVGDVLAALRPGDMLPGGLVVVRQEDRDALSIDISDLRHRVLGALDDALIPLEESLCAMLTAAQEDSDAAE